MRAEDATRSALSAAARAAVERGRIIEAIKIVRSEHNLGLKAAKQAVDAYIDTLPDAPDHARRGGQRSGWSLLLLVLAGAMLAWVALRR